MAAEAASQSATLKKFAKTFQQTDLSTMRPARDTFLKVATVPATPSRWYHLRVAKLII